MPSATFTCWLKSITGHVILSSYNKPCDLLWLDALKRAHTTYASDDVAALLIEYTVWGTSYRLVPAKMIVNPPKPRDARTASLARNTAASCTERRRDRVRCHTVPLVKQHHRAANNYCGAMPGWSDDRGWRGGNGGHPSCLRQFPRRSRLYRDAHYTNTSICSRFLGIFLIEHSTLARVGLFIVNDIFLRAGQCDTKAPRSNVNWSVFHFFIFHLS
jgi:hypothetical protein